MQPPPASMRIRDLVHELAPNFLSEGDAEKLLYTIGLASDYLLEKAYQATLAHLPGRGTPTATPFLGDDRLLVQGPAETVEQYIARIRSAPDAWQNAGARRAVLREIQAYLTGTQPGIVGMLPECTIVGGNGSRSTWDTLYWDAEQGDPPAHILRAPANWTWDGQEAAKPHRAWLILHFHLVATGAAGAAGALSAAAGGFVTLSGPGTLTAKRGNWVTVSGAANAANNGTFPIVTVAAGSVQIANPAAVVPDANSGALAWSIGAYPFIGPALAWDDPGTTWDDLTRSWGLSCRPELVTSIRKILQRWKGAGTYYPWIVYAFDGGAGAPGDWFSPYSAAGAGNPDGTWGPWAKNVNGVMVPARVTAGGRDEFGDGTGRYDQCSVHNVT